MESPLVDANAYVINLEKQYRLFERTLRGIYFWKLVRFNLSREIEMRRGTLEPYKKKPDRRTRLKQLARFVRSIDYCPARSKVVVFEHARKVAHGGGFVDPYSWRVAETLEKAGEAVCLWEADVNYQFQCDLFDKRRWFLSSLHFNATRYSAVEQLPGEIRRLLHNVAQQIASDLGVRVELAEQVLRRLNKFIKEHAYYTRIFRKASPKALFVVCGYGKEGLVQAAKDVGIHTVELQHGTMYPKHLGYAYPEWEYVPYVADSLAVYADAWTTNLPLNGVDIRVIGYAPLTTGDRHGRHRDKTIDILFISQWIHSDRMLQFAREVAKRMPTKRVVCKLHPSDAPPRETVDHVPNLSIQRDGDLGSYLASAVYATTVFSTGIYEALRYGCRPILLDMYGIQYMTDFISVTGAPVVPSPAAFADFVERTDRDGRGYRNLSYTHWFREFDESVVLDYLNGKPCG